ncbi:MAG: cold-shock protein [Gammaproteobacteria bacterium]|nr:cold-shock protein [Gammaproteobacteria bacterium]
MRTGKLKWFDTAKGYGFIEPADGGEDVFVRQAALNDANIDDPKEGTSLNFSVERTPDGLQAKNLALVE